MNSWIVWTCISLFKDIDLSFLLFSFSFFIFFLLPDLLFIQMITATKVCMSKCAWLDWFWCLLQNPTQENVSNEFLQGMYAFIQALLPSNLTQSTARNKLKKVSSAGTIEDITVEEEGKEASSAQDTTSENISHSNLQERTLAILTDTSDLDAIIQLITSNGFTIVTSKKFELTPEEAEEFYQDHAKQNYYEKAVRWLSRYVKACVCRQRGPFIDTAFSSKLCALVLEKENAIKDWRHLMGPTTYKKARKTSPNS